MKVYLACGLTHVPREEFSGYVDFIHGLAAHLERTLNVKVKYALRDSDPQLADKPLADRARLCYLWDKEMVEWADVVVADASHPSTGMGIEMQIACSNEIPIIIAFQVNEKHKAAPVEYETPDAKKHELQLGDGYITLMALGIPSIFKVLPYASSSEAYDLIATAVRTLSKPGKSA